MNVVGECKEKGKKTYLSTILIHPRPTRIKMIVQNPNNVVNLIFEMNYLFRDKKNDILSQIKNIPQGTITQETQLDFADFVVLFKSFK